MRHDELLAPGHKHKPEEDDGITQNKSVSCSLVKQSTNDSGSSLASLTQNKNKYMNAELVKKALEKVLDPYVLVNMVSRRVRQLNAGGGGKSRPLVLNTENLGAADVALREIIEDKMSFDMPEIVELTRPSGRNRRRPQEWGKLPVAKSAGAA